MRWLLLLGMLSLGGCWTMPHYARVLEEAHVSACIVSVNMLPFGLRYTVTVTGTAALHDCINWRLGGDVDLSGLPQHKLP